MLERVDPNLENADSEVIDDDERAERIAFADEMKRLRQLTEGRQGRPGEELIREDRDHGHRDKL